MSDDPLGESNVGYDLCIAMCGDYRCEGTKGHDGPHFALGGEIEWTGELASPVSITGADRR